MKYSIRKNHLNRTMLFEDDIQIGKPHAPELEFWLQIQKLQGRVRELEDVLNEIYHSTSSTTNQMLLIDSVLPQSANRHRGSNFNDFLKEDCGMSDEEINSPPNG